jgi:hypothetical protein
MKAALYSAVGEQLARYEIDVEGATLVRRETIGVPAVVQYASPHPSRRWLYVATSNRGAAAGMNASHNHLSAYRRSIPTEFRFALNSFASEHTAL